jgi:tetratricopeptide (TPR) repeat protein
MSGRSKLLCCTALWLGTVMPVLAAPPEWVEIRSPHFSVVTDDGEKRGREVALRFEQMRVVFGALMTRAKVNLPIPLQIVAFRSTKEMRQFAPLWRGKPTQVAGLFLGGDDRCFIMFDMSVESPWQVVFHEYAHQLMNGNLTSRTDPWFEEGFAEYFSAIEVDSKEARVGKIPEQEYEVLERGGMMKVADLFRVQQNSKTYNENDDHRSVFYAESGMMVHYLYDNGLILKVGTYFDLVHDKKLQPEDAMQQAFGMNAPQFDKALRSYAASGHFKYYPIPTPPGVNGSTYTAAPLPAADAQAVLADVHLHSSDYQDKGMSEFQEVLKLDPNNVAALRGLGYAYLIKQDFHNAGEYFFQAAEHNSNDPRVLYYSALLIQREEGLGLGTDRERLGVIQEQLETSVKLDPDFADAYSLLAFTYMSQGKNDQALATMLKAVELNPHNEAYRLNLSQMYFVHRDFDTALAILRELAQSSDVTVAGRAQQAIPGVEDAKLAAAAGERVEIRSAPTAETLVSRSPEPSAPTVSTVTQPTGPVRYVKGKLMAVDCSMPPAAVMTISSGAKTWKLHANDSTRVVLIGADKFSCAWTNQKVGINYRETGAGTGEVISVELQ